MVSVSLQLSDRGRILLSLWHDSMSQYNNSKSDKLANSNSESSVCCYISGSSQSQKCFWSKFVKVFLSPAAWLSPQWGDNRSTCLVVLCCSRKSLNTSDAGNQSNCRSETSQPFSQHTKLFFSELLLDLFHHSSLLVSAFFSSCVFISFVNCEFSQRTDWFEWTSCCHLSHVKTLHPHKVPIMNTECCMDLGHKLAGQGEKYKQCPLVEVKTTSVVPLSLTSWVRV